MKLGIAMTLSHSTAEEWAEKHKNFGCESVIFPCNCNDNDKKIYDYLKAANDYGLTIAEVGAWCNPMSQTQSKVNIEYCKRQLELADLVGALCCVNIAGTSGGTVWDGAYKENFLDSSYKRIVEITQEIIDSVNPRRTHYSLEPMPYMVPYSPQNYRQLLTDVNRTAFGVHLDIVNMINSPKKYFFNTEFTDKCFDILGNEILSCHLKDIRLERGLTLILKETFCGNGIFDIKNYIFQAEKVNPDMPMIIEHLSDEQSYKDAVQYIKSLLRER